LATSFDIQAAEYARRRPDYPAAAIAAALPTGAGAVLDLAAGTGKLTGPMLGLGCSVIAVEPLPGMLAELHRAFPEARAVLGVAEHIPLRGAVVDAVVVGQAFHWFDADRALAEMARVLRPAGMLSLISNHDDENDAFVRDFYSALTRIGRPVGGASGRGTAPRRAAESGESSTGTGLISGSGVPPFAEHASFTAPELTEYLWQRQQSVPDLIGLMHTYSYVIRASPDARAQLDREIRVIAERHFPGREGVTIPVVCQVWQSICR
jgi:ubiquinone/menaquinone biosynthesis C-methylase UbiE